MQKASDERHKDCEYVASGLTYSKSLFQLMEVELYKVIKEHSAKSRKVSKSFIIINTKKLLKELQPDKAGTFCASDS